MCTLMYQSRGLDGTEFTLGTFTHENYPITGMPQNEFDVDLAVRVVFEDGTEADFSFRFHHNETPNVGPAPEDLVDLPTFVSPETVTIDGEEYAVLISGFKQGGQVVRRFVSPENGPTAPTSWPSSPRPASRTWYSPTWSTRAR